MLKGRHTNVLASGQDLRDGSHNASVLPLGEQEQHC